MKRALLAAIALVVGAPAMASVNCSNSPSTFSLGSLGPPGTTSFSQSFFSTGSFSDCYSFTLSSAANSTGTSAAFDLTPIANISLTSAALYAGSIVGSAVAGSLLGSDGSAGSFSFSNLAAGTYTLVIGSSVSGFLPFGLVGYSGTLKTAAVSVASAVPEGDAFAMALAGIVGVAGVAAAKRRLRS
jgi:hypothetical protein